MIICLNCNNAIKNKMDALLSQGRYRDYSELVAVAVENLWIMEKEVEVNGALIIGEGLAPLRSGGSESTSLEKSESTKVSHGNAPRPRGVSLPTSLAVIPKFFLADGLDGISPSTAKIIASEEPAGVFTLDRWLFGQYNKLLPLKANCRALLRIAAENSNDVPIEDVAKQIAEAAAQLGDYLADHDQRFQIGRDDALSTAFPRSGDDAEKSRARYANQFVGSVNSLGVLSGLTGDYRMATMTGSPTAHLMPTEPAIKFARLPNPVLDGCQVNPTHRFSQDEVSFLLEHIRIHVPSEGFAFQTLIQAIVDGANTPDALDEALRVYVPVDSNRSLSPSFLTSQRSGALSRMADLCLIARERHGVRVLYRITPEGEEFAQVGNARTKMENGRT